MPTGVGISRLETRPYRRNIPMETAAYRGAVPKVSWEIMLIPVKSYDEYGEASPAGIGRRCWKPITGRKKPTVPARREASRVCECVKVLPHGRLSFDGQHRHAIQNAGTTGLNFFGGTGGRCVCDGSPAGAISAEPLARAANWVN